MDRERLTDEDIARLKKREAEIIVRIDRLKRTMNETKAIDTLAFKAKLLREAQDELLPRPGQLAGLSEIRAPGPRPGHPAPVPRGVA